jgi:hypothetical protein
MLQPPLCLRVAVDDLSNLVRFPHVKAISLGYRMGLCWIQI